MSDPPAPSGFDVIAARVPRRYRAHLAERPDDPRDVLPGISVVVATHDRPELLPGCLEALAAQDYPRFEVLLVDNGPSSSAAREIARAFPVRYLHVDRAGTSRARNHGVDSAEYAIVAFTDDDARPEPGWLRWIAAAFSDADVMAVTGRVLAAELDTLPQVWFEILCGGMDKGRQGRVFRRDMLPVSRIIAAQDMGAGVNCAFRRDIFERIGGFDPALGPGTRAGGAEDLDLFHRVVAEGLTLRYEPRAVVRRVHRRDEAGLTGQLRDGGRAYALYLRKVARGRSVPRAALARFATGWWLGLMTRTLKGVVGAHQIPLPLLWAHLRGALESPIVRTESDTAA